MKKKKTKSRNIGYLFKEGIRGIFLHGFMSFAAICVTVACLVIIGSFSAILYNLNLQIKELEQQNQIVAYIDESYNTAQAHSVESEIRIQIENVKEATFVSREDRLKEFKEEQGDADAFTGVNAETLRDRVIITLIDNSKADETVERIKEVKGVVNVNYHSEIATGFTTIQRVLSIASIVIIVVLLIVSLFIISNTIKLAMYDRRDEIAIMKMVGATNSFIRFPYVIEGFFIGLISAVISFFATWGLYDLLADQITRVDSLQLFNIVPFNEILIPLAIVFGVSGLFVGIFGSVMSIRKFLDV